METLSLLIAQLTLAVAIKTAQAQTIPRIVQPPPPIVRVVPSAPKSVSNSVLTPTEAIYKYMGQPEIMVKIAKAESGLNPKAKGPTKDQGLFQIIPSTWKAFNCTGDPYIMLDNIKCAEKIRTGQGLKAWNASKWTKNGWGKYL